MKQTPQLMRNQSRQIKANDVYSKLQRAFLPLMLVLVAGFFIQSEDETGMYIILIVIVVVVGLVNLVRWIFPKNHRRRDKDGHKRGDTHSQHTRSDNGK